MKVSEVLYSILFTLAVVMAVANFFFGVMEVRNKPVRAGMHFSVAVLLVYAATVIV